MARITFDVAAEILTAWTERGLDPAVFLPTYMEERARQFAGDSREVLRKEIAAAYLDAPVDKRDQIDVILDRPPRSEGRG